MIVGWPTKFSKTQIAEALDKGHLSRVVNNGWIRVTSSSTSPVNLGDIKEPGNYVTSFWSDGPYLGEDVVSPINIVVTKIDDILHQFINVGGKKFNRIMQAGSQVYDRWKMDEVAGATNPGPNPPAAPINGKTIWLDTSEPNAPSLKVYVNSKWMEVIPVGSMQIADYDPDKKNVDIFTYIDNAINNSSISTSAAAFYSHIADNNIHTSLSEKEKWNNSATSDDLNNAASELENDISNVVNNVTDNANSSSESMLNTVNELKSDIIDHAANNVIHPSLEKQLEWDNKSNIEHTHNLDGRVDIDIENITGEISSSVMPYDVKERVYIINNPHDLYKLKKNPIHNGDIICVENAAETSWYYVVDDTFMGLERIDNDWIETSIVSTARNWYSVCYGNGRFVATSTNSNKVVYSDDGIVWKETTISNTERYWRSVCYGNGKFVAVAYSSNKFAHSTDGITWTEIDIGTSNRNWVSICYGNGRFVAIANNFNQFAHSTDGITWNFTNVGDSAKAWYHICNGNDKFVAIITNSNEYAYSSNGINWTMGTITDNIRYYQSICYGNGVFVIVSSDEVNSNVFAYSFDGINWNETLLPDVKENWYSVVYGDGKFVAISHSQNHFAYSEDGIYWEVLELSKTARRWSCICYGDGKFVAVAYDSDIFACGSLTLIPSKAFKNFAGGNALNWNKVKDKPSTLDGYGITDGVSIEEVYKIEENVSEIVESISEIPGLPNAESNNQFYTDATSQIETLDSALPGAIETAVSELEVLAGI